MYSKFRGTYLGGRKELKMLLEIYKMLTAGNLEANLYKISLFARKLRGRNINF